MRSRGPRLTRRRFLALASAAAASGLRLAAPPALARQEVPRSVLANGLAVVVEERPSAGTVAAFLAARAGSRDDGELPGLTFFTARVMFQGTARRPSTSEIQRAVAQVGGTISGTADAEWSFLNVVVPSGEIELAFDLLADLAANALFQPASVERQRAVTRQDLARRQADPSALLSDLFQAALFAGHPLGIPVLGTAESVEAISRRELLAQRDRLWCAANLALVVVGRTSREEVLELAERYFGGLPAGEGNQRTPHSPSPPEGFQTVRGEVGEQQAQFRLGYLAPAWPDDDTYALAVLNAITAGPSGRMFAALRSARGLAYVADTAYTAYSDGGAWYVSAGVDPRHVEQAVEVVGSEVERLRDAPPDRGEVERTISQIAGREILAAETNAARARRLAAQAVLGIPTAEEFVRRVRQVTPRDVQRVARAYLDPDRSLLVVVGPPA